MSACNETCTRLATEAAEDAAALHTAIVTGVIVVLGTNALLFSGALAHLLLVNKRRQEQAHRANRQSAAAASAHDAADEAVSSEVEDELSMRAAATLSAAQDAAKRVRRSVNTAGIVVAILALGVLLPLFLVLMVFGLASGHVAVAFVVLVAIAAVTLADPMLPRRARGMLLALTALTSIPGLASIFTGFAVYTALAPNVFFACSTRDPTCKAAAHVSAGFDAALALVIAGVFPLVVPTVYATRERALPPVLELIKRQWKRTAEDGESHPCHLRINPFYLLEGEGYFAMPVHTAIDRVFAAVQVEAFFIGALVIALAIALDTLDIPAFITWGSLLPMGLALLLAFPTILSRPVRRAVVSWLGRLGSREEERQAAAVAALMGGWSPAKALATGKASFSGLPFERLKPADLGKGDLANDDTALSERTIKLALGSCDAFMSHSWHDNADAKWVALKAWATRFEAVKGRPPTLWLDKACINQQAIAASLACLPVYLAGCQKLLVLAGKTYKERLWCVVEVFTFVRMGGALERVEVIPLNTGDDLGFETFAVENAKCFDDNDKAKLLTAIEAAFGAYAPFNALVRGLLVGASGVDAVVDAAPTSRTHVTV